MARSWSCSYFITSYLCSNGRPTARGQSFMVQRRPTTATWVVSKWLVACCCFVSPLSLRNNCETRRMSRRHQNHYRRFPGNGVAPLNYTGNGSLQPQPDSHPSASRTRHQRLDRGHYKPAIFAEGRLRSIESKSTLGWYLSIRNKSLPPDDFDSVY